MKIYTKKGDKGETYLFGGQKVWKDDQRLKAYGLIDELNSILGITVLECKSEELKRILIGIQSELFYVGADLASPLEDDKKSVIKRIDENYVQRIEQLIDNFDEKLPILKNFILPGGTKGSAFLHLARTICRNAEREVVTLMKDVEINKQIEVYLNRLSDLLFVMARYENYFCGIEDIKWVP